MKYAAGVRMHVDYGCLDFQSIASIYLQFVERYDDVYLERHHSTFLCPSQDCSHGLGPD